MRGGRGGAMPPVRKGEGGGEAPPVERDGPRHRESGDANGGTGKGSTKGGDAARHEGRGGEKVNIGYGFLRIGGFDGFGTDSSRPSK